MLLLEVLAAVRYYHQIKPRSISSSLARDAAIPSKRPQKPSLMGFPTPRDARRALQLFVLASQMKPASQSLVSACPLPTQMMLK